MYSDDEGEFTLGGRRGGSPSPDPRRSGGGRDRGGGRGGRSRSRDDRRDGGHRRQSRSRDRRGHAGGRDGRSRSRGGRSRSRGREDRGRFGGGGKGDRSPFRDLGKERVLGKGKGKDRPKTTGRALPKLYSIHKGSVVSVQSYGAFVRLGDGSEYKDGLLHISRLSASGRVEKVEDILSQDDKVFVKVVEVKDEEAKYSVDMRFVNQTSGEDQDPNNVHIDAGGGKGKGGKPEPIRIGAIQATTCSRCGAKGHSAKECFAAAGKNYELLDDLPAETAPPVDTSTADKPPSAIVGHDPKVVKAALKAYLKKQTPGDDGSSSSSSSDKKKKKKKKEKKKEKKERKKLKKQLKKEKKEQKKKIKELKKRLKEEAQKAEEEAKEQKAAKNSKDAKEKMSKKEGKKEATAKEEAPKAAPKAAKADQEAASDSDDSSSSSSS